MYSWYYNLAMVRLKLVVNNDFVQIIKQIDIVKIIY